MLLHYRLRSVILGSMIGHLPVHDLIGHCLSVVNESKRSSYVDEHAGPIVLERVLGGAVVLWECVVEVVTSFSDGGNGGEDILNWRDRMVVWLPSEAETRLVR